MTEQTGMGGFGGQIKSTPMGPFKWNDYTQLWENVNNGMVLNNISFQDMVAMDYVSVDGGSLVTPTGVLYGTIPMIFGPTSYSITSNWDAGSTAGVLPSIQVPSGYPNFDIKFVSDGGFGGSISTINMVRNRAGTLATFIMGENTLYPPGPGVMQAGDIMTFEIKSAGFDAIGTEQYTLYFYDSAGTTLSNGISVDVNIPANPTPFLNAVWGSLANIPDGATAYWASTGGSVPFSGGSQVPASVSFGLNTIITINLTQTKSVPSLDNLDGLYYSIQSGPPILYSGGFTMANGQSLRVGAKAPAVSLNGGAGTLNVINASDSSTVLEAIPYSFDAS
jgi:hypothetical protein